MWNLNGICICGRPYFPRARLCFGLFGLFIFMPFPRFLLLFERWRGNIKFTNEQGKPSRRVQHACAKSWAWEYIARVALAELPTKSKLENTGWYVRPEVLDKGKPMSILFNMYQ